MAFEANLSDFTIYAYTINAKSNLGTPKRQLFGLVLLFSESPNQKEWENGREGLKVENLQKWATLQCMYC